MRQRPVSGPQQRVHVAGVDILQDCPGDVLDRHDDEAILRDFRNGANDIFYAGNPPQYWVARNKPTNQTALFRCASGMIPSMTLVQKPM